MAGYRHFGLGSMDLLGFHMGGGTPTPAPAPNSVTTTLPTPPPAQPLPQTVNNFLQNPLNPAGEYYYPLLLITADATGWQAPPPGLAVYVGAGQEFVGGVYWVTGPSAPPGGMLHVLRAGEHLARFNKPQDTVSPLTLSEGQVAGISTNLWLDWNDAGKPRAWGAGYHHKSTGGWVDDLELGLEIAGAAIATGLTLGAGAPLLAAAVGAAAGESIADPGSVTAVKNDIVKAGQQTVAEVARIPDNVVGYIQNPRSFIQAAADNLADGWGAPLLFLLGPIGIPVLMSIQAGANAHNLSDFGIAVGREAAKGGAVDLAVGLLAVMTNVPLGSIGANPIYLGMLGDIVVPDQALVSAAKAVQYIQGFIPFFPEAIDELTIQAQQTRQERDSLRIKLAQLQAQINKNGGIWYAEAKIAFHAVVAVLMAIATAGGSIPADLALTAAEQMVMNIAQTCLSAAGTALQMVNVKQTLDATHTQQRQDNSQAEGIAQTNLDALKAQLAALQHQAQVNGVVPVSTPPYGKIAIGVAFGGGLLYAVTRTHRGQT